jgi:hypothetical protein
MFLQCLISDIQGVVICVGGLGLLVVSDFVTDKNYPALNKGKGDGFMIAGATLYGFSASFRSCRRLRLTVALP